MIATSQPRSSAGKPSGLAQVLSIRLIAPFSRATAAKAGMSGTSIVRLPGASNSTARVSGVKRAVKPSRSSGSKNSVVTPKLVSKPRPMARLGS